MKIMFPDNSYTITNHNKEIYYNNNNEIVIDITWNSDTHQSIHMNKEYIELYNGNVVYYSKNNNPIFAN